MTENDIQKPQNFIRKIIDEDLKNGKNSGRIATRFPPEPNGYLHIGHAKSICLNFGIARDYNGTCNLRFDDSNPAKEDIEYVDAIKEDIKWLGFDWGNRLFHASDYFDKLHDYAIDLIKNGKAYVCHLNAEETRKYRGTLTEAGKDSPYRNRTTNENLDFFRRMREGEFNDGECVLRAKIDMAAPNINLRDPTLYRIKKVDHHKTGNKWCIYPMYDFTHGLSDSLEGITHSICTLEFEDHRPLYYWFLDNLHVNCRPQQIEFSRLNLDFTIMSKRKLIELVNEGLVNGWDDPRMPTIQGIRRRGFTPESIRDFCEKVGVTKKDNCIEMTLLENCVREDLDNKAPRVMGVINPLKLIIDNYPDEQEEELDAPLHPKDESFGARKLKFSKILYIEKTDFLEEPPKKFFRLGPGREVRLRYAYFVKCESFIKDANSGEISEIHCTYDPATKGGNAPDGRKVKGTIHWVSAKHALNAEIRLYDRLFNVPNPGTGTDKTRDFKLDINPTSLEVIKNAKVEYFLKNAKNESSFQFERQGYFCTDRFDSKPESLVFNRTVTLKDSWAKIEQGKQ